MSLLNCIKCNQPYEESEPEPYYCPPCLVERKKLAEEIDRKMGSLPRVKVKSELEQYDEMVKTNGGRFPNYRNFLH